MVSKTVRMGICLLALTVLVACGQSRELTPNAVKTGPDEFGLVPNKPLQQPASFSSLPAPTPGGANLTDATPKADAILALGGRVPPATGVDGGIVSYASRYGVDPLIRVDLAKSDARRSKARSGFLGLGGKSYERAYRGLALDAVAEWERLRVLGIVVPSAPQD